MTRCPPPLAHPGCPLRCTTTRMSTAYAKENA